MAAPAIFTILTYFLFFMNNNPSAHINDSSHQYLLVGTYTNTGSKGIYVFDMNMETGELKEVSNIASENPSFLAVHDLYVYAVNENAGENGGGISSYRFDRKSGKLHFLNSRATGGDHPCYVGISGSGRMAAVANYTGGSLAVFPIAKDGSLRPRSQLIQHSGSGLDPQRQEKAHVHSTRFSPDSKYLLSADLGLDKLFVFQVDEAREKLTPVQPPFVATGAGSGPRHTAFAPNGKFVYLVNELNGMVIAYGYREGRLQQIQQIGLSATGQTKNMDGAEIRVSPDGRFLYASSRNTVNTITIYAIGEDGKLTRVDVAGVKGDHPRNFTIDDSGRFLIVANKNSDNIVVFKRNQETGLLTDTGIEVKLPQPVCVVLTSKS